MSAWLRDAYRGFLWPWLTFASSGIFGAASETRSWWHDLQWPSFAVAVISLQIATAKIAKREGKP